MYPMVWHCRCNFSGGATVGNYDDCCIRVSRSATVIMYTEKLMMIISFTHKLILAATHYADNFKSGFLNPLKPPRHPLSVIVNTLNCLLSDLMVRK